MTICDKCPCHVWSYESIQHHLCSITDVGLYYDDKHWTMCDAGCELEEIKLKDGTVFRPEVVK